MADKNDFRQAAFELAIAELRGRLVYEEYRSGNVTKAELQAYAAEAEKRKQQAELLRREVPGAEGKSYWWDIPYEIDSPSGSFPDTFALPGGIYTEQDDFKAGYGFELERAEQFDSVHMMSEFYLSSDRYVTLYADRKALKANLAAKVHRKAILCAEEKLPTHQDVGEYQGERPYDVRNRWEYRHLQSEIQSIAGRLPGELNAYDEWHDNAERVWNGLFENSPFTNQERWLMGEMDSDSYYTSDMYRDLRRMEKEEKAREEISRMEYQMKEMQRQAAKVQAQYQRYQMQRARAKMDKGITLRFMRCGYAFYLENRLAAVLLSNRPEPVWQIHHTGTVSPYQIFGRIGDCQEVDRRMPDPAPCIDFILQEYGSRLKPYSPLALRPKYASDEIWRYWAESRLENFLLCHTEQ